MIFKLGEMFSGPGGIGYGAKLAKVNADGEKYAIDHAWATDYDKDTCKTFTHNIFNGDDTAVVCEDIRELDIERLAKISDIDAFAFGFPCNDFSIVGEQKGMDGVYGPLYSYGVKVLKRFQPKWFIAENVGGLRNANDGESFKKILKDLELAGYELTPHLYKFEEYGIPQARHRIIIVGIRKDLNLTFKVPSQKPFSNIDVSSQNAIENPPIATDAFNHERTIHAQQVVERLKHIKPGENAFTAQMPEHLQLKVQGAKISQIYKRLHPNKPAYTITGSGGGGTHVYHWSEHRALTNRERARLQTFPDNFEFKGSKESVRKQIGMAVPPKGAQIIFECILKTFAYVDYENIEPNIKI